MQKSKNNTDINNKNKYLSSQNTSKTTNPIDNSGLVAKINVLGSGINSVKLSHSAITHHNEKSYGAVDYAGFIKETNEIIKNYTNLKDSLNAFHNMFVNRLNCNYTAIGLINEQSNNIQVKLLDKSSNVFSYKVFMSDKENEIVKALESDEIKVLSNSEFLNIPSLSAVPSVIIPIKIQGRCICVAFASDYNVQNHISLYQLASMNLGLLLQNSDLYKKVAQNSYMDSLTNLYSHRRFHELLSQELTLAEANDEKVSVCADVCCFGIQFCSCCPRQRNH